MSFVTFVRDYVQDPDKIIHLPNFIFDACKNFIWYVFSFQWLRSLTYVTLSHIYPEALSVKNGVANGNSSLPTGVGEHVSDLASSLLPSATEGVRSLNSSAISTMATDFFQATGLYSFIGDKQSFSSFVTSLPVPLAKAPMAIAEQVDGANLHQFSFIHYSVYGLLNGITSTLHFCAVTIILVHILLNENKKRAFRVALIGCFSDFSCMILVFFGLRNLIIPWVALEPLSYCLGFIIQFFFALAIIKDNRRIKGNRKNKTQEFNRGQLSSNYWLLISVFLFSWCEQTQVFQTLASNTIQPTATLFQVPFSSDNALTFDSNGATFMESSWSLATSSISSLLASREIKIFSYLITFLISRIGFTWVVLSFFQNVIEWKDNGLLLPNFLTHSKAYESKTSFEVIGNKNNIFSFIANLRFVQFLRSTSQRFIRRFVTNTGGLSSASVFESKNVMQNSSIQSIPSTKTSNILRDPLAIAAVTCSLAFLPAYSSNLLVMKSVGFFPDENRTQHSFFSPWDMPVEILAIDEDAVGKYHNLAEYPFFLPFYDKGEYGGWSGIGEEDLRYGPSRLWQTRRIRAPWRRTTLQEPALTFANDKSLLVDPNPKIRQQETVSIKSGLNFGPIYANKQRFSFINPLVAPLEQSKVTDTKVSAEKSLISVPLRLPKASKKISKPFENWKYLRKQFNTRNVYTKLLTIDYLEGLKNTLSTSGVNVSRSPSKNLKGASTFDLGSYTLPVDKGTQSLGSDLVTFGQRSSSESETKILTEDLGPQGGISTTGLTTFSNNYPTNNKDFSIITKIGRKKLLERLKKPVRKLNTSKLFDSASKNSFLSIENENKSGSTALDPLPYAPLSAPSHLLERSSSKQEGHTQVIRGKLQQGTEKQESKIKNNKQIRKRFKKFKRKLQHFRAHSYKKRNTKIKRLKHFHYLKNKKKKRRKSRRLIYKLRRQYPYLRNIKERKAKLFGLYSPLAKSHSSFDFASVPSITKQENVFTFDTLSKPYTSHVKQPAVIQPMLDGNKQGTDKKSDVFGNDTSMTPYHNQVALSAPSYPEGVLPELRSGTPTDTPEEHGYNRQDVMPSTKEYKISTKNFSKSVESKNQTIVIGNTVQKNIYNSKEADIPEKMKPSYSTAYPRRKNSINIKKDFGLIFRTQIGERLDFAREEIRARIFLNPYIRFLLNNRIDNFISREKLFPEKIAPLTSITEQDLFKRRLIISKYADAVDFLKPKTNHSYIDSIYNHQFKGTLSTARRLFSLKVQFDQPLLHPTDYIPATKHENISSSFYGDQRSCTEGAIKGQEVNDTGLDNKEPIRLLKKHQNVPNSLLEKTALAPLYAAWDPKSRKLVITNRFLNYKTVTQNADSTTGRLLPSTTYAPYLEQEQGQRANTKNIQSKQLDTFAFVEGASTNKQKEERKFTSWPLKEPYFKDNEFLVSQLYSNSQPIDSFVSQEREKARPVALPRRVNSFNTILNYKTNIQATEAQRSQQFLKIEGNDKKTFLFKHFWSSSNGANLSQKTNQELNNRMVIKDRAYTDWPKAVAEGKTGVTTMQPFVEQEKIGLPISNVYKMPTSAEQRKILRVDEREYPLWMALRTLPPNQGGFLWPGD